MKNIKKISIFAIIITFCLLNIVTTSAAGKRIIAENKYIWIYIEGKRKLLPDNMGYPCFGQGIDNKNVLYVPLRLLTDITGSVMSPLKKSLNEDGTYNFLVEVSGDNTYTVFIDEPYIGSTKLAGTPFVLKGTEIKSNVVMVPLGFAKDGLGLDIEVERPVGRGVFDYCSLAINFSGENINLKKPNDIINTPISESIKDKVKEESIKDALEGVSTDLFYVSLSDEIYYHAYSCPEIRGKTISTLNEYEAVHWGYIPHKECVGH